MIPEDPNTYFEPNGKSTRGYTSYNNFAHVIEKGQYFLIRCNDKRASGMLGYSVDSLPAFDENINLILTRSKAVKNYSRPEMFSA